MGRVDRIPGRRWVFGVSLWLLLVPIALCAVRVWVPSDGLPVVEASGAFNADGLRVSPPSPVAGILEGDSVVSIDGAKPADLLGDPRSRQVQRGDRLSVVVQRAGARFTAVVVVRDRRQLGALFRKAWPLLSAGLIVVGLVVWLLRRRPDEPAAQALLLLSASFLSLTIGAVAFLEPLDLLVRPWLVAWSLLGTAGFMELAVALVLFGLAFPAGRTPGRLDLIVRRSAAVPIVVSVASAMVYLLGGWSLGANNALDQVAGLWWLLGVVVAIGLLVAGAWRGRRDLVIRRQTQIVLFGSLASLVPWIVLNVVPNRVPGVWFALIFLPFPASIVAAVAHRNLFELELVLRRGLVAAITAVVLFAVYATVVVSTASIAGSSGVLVAVPAAAAVAVLFAPVRDRAGRWARRRLFGLAAEPGGGFDRLGVRLATAGDPDALLAAIVETVTESLRLPYSAVELLLGGEPRVVEQRGEPTDVVRAVPMANDGEAVGRLLISPRRGEKDLSTQDSALLANLARHAAVAARVSLLTNELRETQHHVVVSREIERDRVQRDLHDRIGPVLVGLSLQLSALTEDDDIGRMRASLGRLEVQAKDALEDVRRLARDLRPAELEDIGLFAALDAAAARMSSAGGFTVEVEAPLVLPRLSRQQEDAAYMVALEAMNNAVRHSCGGLARIRLSVGPDPALHVVIEDDGVGIGRTCSEGTGLRSMRTRVASCGGTLAIESAALGGARVSFRLPMENEGHR